MLILILNLNERHLWNGPPLVLEVEVCPNFVSRSRTRQREGKREMAPKKKGGKGGGKKKKGGCPDWMAPELYALTQDLAKLQEFWCGEIKESKGKGKDGQPLPQPPNITREQVGKAAGRRLLVGVQHENCNTDEISIIHIW